MKTFLVLASLVMLVHGEPPVYNAPLSQIVSLRNYQLPQNSYVASSPSLRDSYAAPQRLSSYAAPSRQQSYSQPQQSYGQPAPPPSDSYGEPAPPPTQGGYPEQTPPPSGGYPEQAPPSQEYGPGPEEPPKVHKHIYVHTAPSEPYKAPPKQYRAPQRREKHYKIIFIKAPTEAPQEAPEIELPLEPETKTLVYVLIKKPEPTPEIVIPTQAPTKPSKPEVYFIRYKDKEEASSGGYGPPPEQGGYGSTAPKEPESEYGQPAQPPQNEYGTPNF